MILLTGCSFMHNYSSRPMVERFGTSNIIQLGQTAAGNRYISNSIIETIMRRPGEIEYVFALWTGINRCDIPLGNNVSKTLNNKYFNRELYNQTWYHSGGIMNVNDSLTNDGIDKIFKLHYLEDNKDYYTEEYDKQVYTAELFLKALNIPYDFGSIYDYAKASADDQYSLGTVSKSVPLHHTLNIPTSPYDYCKEKDLLGDDDFHPTTDGMQTWFNSVKLKIDK